MVPAAEPLDHAAIVQIVDVDELVLEPADVLAEVAVAKLQDSVLDQQAADVFDGAGCQSAVGPETWSAAQLRAAQASPATVPSAPASAAYTSGSGHSANSNRLYRDAISDANQQVRYRFLASTRQTCMTW
jgi:hypothetical protein